MDSCILVTTLLKTICSILYLHSGLHIVNNMRNRQRNIRNQTYKLQDASRENNIDNIISASVLV